MERSALIDSINGSGLAEAGFGEGPIGGYLMQQHPSELADLVLALIGKPIRTYLQVGSAAGGTERFLCEQLGISELVIIDTGDHPQFSTWRYKNKPALQAAGVKISEHIGDSHEEEAAEFLRGFPKFDLIGIDGDHTPAGVRMDWDLITPALRPGSLVWLHDINHAYMRARDNGPWEVWCKLRERHNPLLEVMERFGIGLVEIK